MASTTFVPGTLITSVWLNQVNDYLFEESASAIALGAAGDGVTDDSVAIEAALASGVPVRFPSNTTYNLGGDDLTITGSVLCLFGTNVTFTNGRIRFRPSDAIKAVVFSGNVRFEDASIRVQGVADGAHTDYFNPDSGAVTLICNNIDVVNMYSGGGATTSVDLWNLKNSVVGVVSVTGTAGGVSGSQAVLCQDIYDSKIVGFNVNGGWVMGVHFDSSSTRGAYSLCRTEVGFVNVEKNIADESGDHGCYLHGAYKSSIGNVYGEGWGATVSSCATFKFRDNLGCYIRSVSVDRMRVTADNNYAFFTQINRANIFEDIFCSVSFTAVATSPGYSLDNTIKNFRVAHYSADSNQATQSGFVFTGVCSIGVDTSGADINTYGLVFDGANVSLVNSPDFVGNYFTAKNTTFNNNLSLVPTSASTTTLQNVRINGNFTHDGASAAHTFVWNHTHVTGTISIASSGASRTTSATWRFVSSDAVEIVDTTFRPETKNYRFVAFSDVVYDLL